MIVNALKKAREVLAKTESAYTTIATRKDVKITLKNLKEMISDKYREELGLGPREEISYSELILAGILLIREKEGVNDEN
jgi:hypothetical protein